MASASQVRKWIFILLKASLAVALLSYLIYQVRQDESFSQLVAKEKDWPLLGAAFAICLSAIMVSFVRWMLLVRALAIPFSLSDAFRLGFIGFFLNFFSLGSVGGDLFKAIFIAREKHGRRTEAVATVIIDRIVGLYALLLVASGAILLGNLHAGALAEVQIIKQLTLALTVAGAAGIGLLLIPGVTSEASVRRLARVPGVGRVAAKVVGAIRIYRADYGVIAAALAMGVAVHGLMSVCVWLVACALSPAPPALAEHFFIVPLASLVGAIPLTPSGLGQFETALALMYEHMSVAAGATMSLGFAVAIGFRVLTMIVALGGVYYFLRGRREVAEVMHDAEAAEEERGQDSPGITALAQSSGS